MIDEDNKALAARAKLTAAVYTLSREALTKLFEGLVEDGVCERVMENGEVRYQIRLRFDA